MLEASIYLAQVWAQEVDFFVLLKSKLGFEKSLKDIEHINNIQEFSSSHAWQNNNKNQELEKSI